MWFFKKNQKIENNVVSELSEYEALDELISRLEKTPILSKEEEDKRHKPFIKKVIDRMIDEGVTRGLSSDGIPLPDEILSMAHDLIRDHGLNARVLSDEMRMRAYKSGSETEFFHKHLVWEKVMQLTYRGFSGINR